LKLTFGSTKLSQDPGLLISSMEDPNCCPPRFCRKYSFEIKAERTLSNFFAVFLGTLEEETTPR